MQTQSTQPSELVSTLEVITRGPTTQDIRAAEDHLRSMLNQNQVEVIVQLLSIIHAESGITFNAAIRLLAMVYLDIYLPAGEPPLITTLEQPVQDYVTSQLTSALLAETDQNAARKLVHLISRIAQANAWDGLAAFLVEHLTKLSTTPGTTNTHTAIYCLMILADCCDVVYDDVEAQIQHIYALLNAFFTHGELPIRCYSSHLILKIIACSPVKSTRIEFRKLHVSVLATIQHAIESRAFDLAQLMLSWCIDIVVEHEETMVWQQSLTDSCRFLSSIAVQLPFVPDHIRHLALELLISIAVTKPTLVNQSMESILSKPKRAGKASGAGAKRGAAGTPSPLLQAIIESSLHFAQDLYFPEDSNEWHQVFTPDDLIVFTQDNDTATASEMEEGDANHAYGIMTFSRCVDLLTTTRLTQVVLPYLEHMLHPSQGSQQGGGQPPSWQQQVAGLTALSQVLGDKFPLEKIPMRLILDVLQGSDCGATHPRVHYAAAMTLGVCCTEYTQFAYLYHEPAIQALLKLVAAQQSPRLQQAGCSVLHVLLTELSTYCHDDDNDGDDDDNHGETTTTAASVREGIFTPQLIEVIFTALMSALSVQRYQVQCDCLSTIATLSECNPVTFLPYASTVLSCLEQILYATPPPNINLRCKAIESFTFVCCTIYPVLLEHEKSNHQQQQQQLGGFSSTDIVTICRRFASSYVESIAHIDSHRQHHLELEYFQRYLVRGLSRICTILVDEFHPYLPYIVPPLLSSLAIPSPTTSKSPMVSSLRSSIKLDLSSDVSQDDVESILTQGHAANPSTAAQMLSTFSTLTDYYEDTSVALSIVQTFVTELPQYYKPYAHDTYLAIRQYINYPQNMDIQQQALVLIPSLLKALVLWATDGEQSTQLHTPGAAVSTTIQHTLIQRCTEIFNELLSTLLAEVDHDISLSILSAISLSVDETTPLLYCNDSIHLVAGLLLFCCQVVRRCDHRIKSHQLPLEHFNYTYTGPSVVESPFKAGTTQHEGDDGDDDSDNTAPDHDDDDDDDDDDDGRHEAIFQRLTPKKLRATTANDDYLCEQSFAIIAQIIRKTPPEHAYIHLQWILSPQDCATPSIWSDSNITLGFGEVFPMLTHHKRHQIQKLPLLVMHSFVQAVQDGILKFPQYISLMLEYSLSKTQSAFPYGVVCEHSAYLLNTLCMYAMPCIAENSDAVHAITKHLTDATHGFVGFIQSDQPLLHIVETIQHSRLKSRPSCQWVVDLPYPGLSASEEEPASPIDIEDPFREMFLFAFDNILAASWKFLAYFHQCHRGELPQPMRQLLQAIAPHLPLLLDTNECGAIIHLICNGLLSKELGQPHAGLALPPQPQSQLLLAAPVDASHFLLQPADENVISHVVLALVLSLNDSYLGPSTRKLVAMVLLALFGMVPSLKSTVLAHCPSQQHCMLVEASLLALCEQFPQS